jgi:hypothetical protein
VVLDGRPSDHDPVDQVLCGRAWCLADARSSALQRRAGNAERALHEDALVRRAVRHVDELDDSDPPLRLASCSLSHRKEALRTLRSTRAE